MPRRGRGGSTSPRERHLAQGRDNIVLVCHLPDVLGAVLLHPRLPAHRPQPNSCSARACLYPLSSGDNFDPIPRRILLSALRDAKPRASASRATARDSPFRALREGDEGAPRCRGKWTTVRPAGRLGSKSGPSLAPRPLPPSSWRPVARCDSHRLPVPHPLRGQPSLRGHRANHVGGRGRATVRRCRDV